MELSVFILQQQLLLNFGQIVSEPLKTKIPERSLIDKYGMHLSKKQFAK
jgi:hypothetical protein